MRFVKLCARVFRVITPRSVRVWLDALDAESAHISSDERPVWRKGATSILITAFKQSMARDLWLAPIVLLLAGALSRLHLEYGGYDPASGLDTTIFLERLQDPPSSAAYGAWLLGAIALWSFVRPTGAWRWALLASLCLPAWIYVASENGSYFDHRADSFYFVPPAVLTALIALWLRRRFEDHILSSRIG